MVIISIRNKIIGALEILKTIFNSQSDNFFSWILDHRVVLFPTMWLGNRPKAHAFPKTVQCFENKSKWRVQGRRTPRGAANSRVRCEGWGPVTTQGGLLLLGHQGVPLTCCISLTNASVVSGWELPLHPATLLSAADNSLLQSDNMTARRCCLSVWTSRVTFTALFPHTLASPDHSCFCFGTSLLSCLATTAVAGICRQQWTKTTANQQPIRHCYGY